jgi:hypothetical protein
MSQRAMQLGDGAIAVAGQVSQNMSFSLRNALNRTSDAVRDTVYGGDKS